MRGFARIPCVAAVARAVLAALLVLAASFPVPALAVGPNNSLNDSGATAWGNDTTSALTAEPVTHPRQDASQGRDAAARSRSLPKFGGGSKGFDYTKIANNGLPLTATAALGSAPGAWACTLDNVTGLLWELKADDPAHLRHYGHTYTWYSSTAPASGSVGTSVPGVCHTAGRCDTEKFVQDVNAAGLCGHADWRLPTVDELISIVDYGIAVPGPAIDAGFFPNTGPASGFLLYWTSLPRVDFPAFIWSVNFAYGNSANGSAVSAGFVRLVRSGP